MKQFVVVLCCFMLSIAFSTAYADEPRYAIKINCFPDDYFMTLDTVPVIYNIQPDRKKLLLQQNYFEAADLEKSPYQCTFTEINSSSITENGFSKKETKIAVEGKTVPATEKFCMGAGIQSIRILVNGKALPWIELAGPAATCSSIFRHHHVEVYNGHMVQCTSNAVQGIAYDDFDSGKADYKKLPAELACYSRSYNSLWR